VELLILMAIQFKEASYFHQMTSIRKEKWVWDSDIITTILLAMYRKVPHLISLLWLVST